MRLEGKKVLLVGATGILGRGYSETLAAEGAAVALADLQNTDVMDLARELGGTGVEIDVTDESSVVDAVARAVLALGGLDGVVTNAAATGEFLMREGNAFEAFEDYPLETWQRALDVNLSGTFLVAREAGRAMKNDGGGSFVTVSSIYGVVAPDHRIYRDQPFRSFAAYSASKAGVIGLTQWLATWWANDNIRVNCLVPGGVFNGQPASFVEAYAQRTPMNRMANPDDMTGTLVYLLSDDSLYCTGQCLIIDGGLTTW